MILNIFADFYDMVLNVMQSILFLVQITILVYLIITEVQGKDQIKTSLPFTLLLVYLVIVSFEGFVSGINNLNFSLFNYQWYLHIISLLGIPIYAILVFTRKSRK
jgi:ABC-type nickel/cobalt efflux system permease component RcnA